MQIAESGEKNALAQIKCKNYILRRFPFPAAKRHGHKLVSVQEVDFQKISFFLRKKTQPSGMFSTTFHQNPDIVTQCFSGLSVQIG